MPQKLYDFFQTPSVKTPTGGANIAGFIDGKNFKYYESSSTKLPAVVNALQAKAKSNKATIYTNSLEALWIKHYPLIKVKHMDALKSAEGDGAVEVTPVVQVTKKWPRRLGAMALAAPLAGGGLYAAAAGLSKDLDLPAGSRKKGLARALRYYMLAAYSLVDISSEESYEGLRNYVGALLVSDQGKILAAGINTGSYRHAEVSMLLSYFRDNPTATTIPERSIIFSTLTPCRGCTGYLSAARSTDSVIYFGQEDTGKDGKVGARISAQLSAKTKEPHGQSKDILPGSVDVEDVGGDGVVSGGSISSIHKIQVDKGLASCMGEGSIATQIGKAKESRALIRSSSDALVHKMLKSRQGGDDEHAVKDAVLHYIGQWLGTSKSLE